MFPKIDHIPYINIYIYIYINISLYIYIYIHIDIIYPLNCIDRYVFHPFSHLQRPKKSAEIASPGSDHRGSEEATNPGETSWGSFWSLAMGGEKQAVQSVTLW